jgi:hypothetical protein
MPTIIQPTWAPESTGNSGLSQAFGQVQQAAQYLQGKKAAEAANKFGAINNIIAKTFPDELGGFTAAYRSGNPQQAAAADQALGLYLNSVEGITGKRLSPQEREAIKGAFVNGQLTTKQLLANAQAQVMSPQGQAQAQGAPVQGAQMQNAQGPATPVAATGPIGQISSVPSQPRNIETMQPQGQGQGSQPGQVLQEGPQQAAVTVPQQTSPVPQVPNAPSQYAGVAVQAAPASALSPNPYMERGFTPTAGSTPQGTYQGRTYTPDQQEANRQKVLEVLSFGVYKSPATKAAEADKARNQGMNAKGAAAQKAGVFQPGADTSSDQFTDAVKSLTPEQLSLVQNEVSRETPEGGRAIPTGMGTEIALDKRELTNVARAVKGTSTLMDTLMKARNADELGRKAYSVTRALETAAALVPGSKEMDREWAAGTVRAIMNATPQELVALGLNEEAKTIISNDQNRIAAEANSINLFSTLKRAAVDLTQLETSKRIAELQYLGAVAASTGTQQGILTKGLTDITVALINAGAGAAGGKPQTGAQLGKYFEQAGLKNFKQFVEGLYGGSGSELRTLGGINLPFIGNVGGTEAFMPAAPGDLGVTGATPSAYAGQLASGVNGGGAPSNGMTSSAQKSMTKASGIDQYFDQGGVQDTYQRNARKMTAEWQAFLASQQQ